MKLENQFCFAVYACAREITKLYHPLLKELNLTYTQYITMLALWEKDDVSVKELGERLYLDSGTLTPLLKKLEASGHLTRTRDQSDERSVRIVLTEQGRSLKERACTIPEQLYRQYGMGIEELTGLRNTMTDVLKKIHDHGQSQESN
ncbi:MarR family winged helix-turn-helix transcriptional regulator [Cohnella sp. AR92]|uniref:MarR family winged helix-turn-helix transcriptional regulator n=1 Tax=Cohnella sp. AR92 TaxID=648716 RepID=UPI000F8EA594|nr:MarR family transcriptional regulator [Cohnella sp. AR92]